MKYAMIDITTEVLPVALTALIDCGLRVTGSADSGDGLEERVRLIVKDEFGIILPAECAQGRWLVRPEITVETYGKQRLYKITGFRLIEVIEPLAAAA
jgi:hypothetical protein